MTEMRLVTLFAVLVMAPALPGIATRTKSFLTGRRGAPVFQLYADLAKLVRKGVVYSRTVTVLFRAAPVVLTGSVLVAALLLPLDGRTPIFGFTGDLVAFAGLLGLGRMALVLAGLDTGSSFEGMGTSREVTVAAFAEPALLLSFTVLVLATGRLSLGGMLGMPLAAAWPSVAPSLVLAAASLFMLLLAENARVPIDDPATHLELTMIHEVMILDHSGPDLALILFAGAVKFALFSALIVSVLIPLARFGPWVSVGLLLGGLAALAVLVGIIEAVMARLRMDRIPQFLVAASALAGFGVILLLR
jgi:formate hydrogenlyase subunit 4